MLDHIPLGYYASAGLLNFLSSLILSIFVVSKNRKSAVNKVFSFFALGASCWGLFHFLWFITVENARVADFYLRTVMIFVILVPAAFTHFILTFLKVDSARQINRANYSISFLFALTAYTNLFAHDIRPFLIFPYWLKPGPVFHFHLVHFLANIIYSHYLMLRAIKNSTGRMRQQVFYIFIGTAIGYTTGVLNYLPWYRVPIPPFLNPLVSIYVATIAYAIIRHQLMDIEVIIRRTLVFAGLFSFAFAIFAFSTFLTQELMSSYISGRSGRVLSLIISVFLIVLVYEPLRRFLINLTDRFLFQKKYDYRKLLRDASAGISQIKSLHQLLSLVTHFTTMRIRVRNAAILIHDEKNDYFKLAYMRGYDAAGWLKENHIFNEGDPLIYYLAHERIPLDVERVKEFVETGGPKPKKGMDSPQYNYKAIKDRMEELRAACCVPSFLGNNLRNVLILGEKKSGDFFSDEDLNVLYTLAQESAIAIENARLYDQAIEKARELEGINEQLNTAQTNLLRALNDTEIANKKLRDTHAQLIHEQKMATLGRLASSVGHEVNNPLTILSMNVSRMILKYRQNPDLKVTEILEIFHKMEQNISRIKAVVNTLTGLLKKSEHGKFEALSLKLVLEETLPLVQFQTYLDNLSGTEVIFDIPGNIPLIKGDLERLQEVFLNLFINAYHAMAGKRDRKITVTAHEDPAHPAMVVVQFSDNGHGMGDEVMKKIFSYGFTTKPTGKGTGMGLYMCRYIIELHGGEIKVRSKVGEGTTFIITLPIAREQSTLESGESAEEK